MQSGAPCEDSVIYEALLDDWGVTADELKYSPVGYGSWHWDVQAQPGGRLFLTVDEVAGDPASADDHHISASELAWAYRVPLELSRAGESLARPPLLTGSGAITARIGARLVASLWPYIEGRSSHEGRFRNQGDAGQVLDLLERLHQIKLANLGVLPARMEDFRIPGLGNLFSLLDGAWPNPLVGPLAARGAKVLHQEAGAIRRLASNYTALVGGAPPASEWVLTHGEPHAANVVFTDTGPVLIDWDTCKVAPRERDLWMIRADGFAINSAEESILSLYQAQWDLGEIIGYARRFADPQDDGPEGEPAWNDFMSYIQRAADI